MFIHRRVVKANLSLRTCRGRRAGYICVVVTLYQRMPVRPGRVDLIEETDWSKQIRGKPSISAVATTCAYASTHTMDGGVVEVSSSTCRAHKRNVETAPILVPPELMCVWSSLHPGLLPEQTDPLGGEATEAVRVASTATHSLPLTPLSATAPLPHNIRLPGNDAIAIENVLTPYSSIYLISSRKISKHSCAGPSSCTMATRTT